MDVLEGIAYTRALGRYLEEQESQRQSQGYLNDLFDGG